MDTDYYERIKFIKEKTENFRSENLEGTASYCIGRWWKACEDVKEDREALDRACQRFWFGVKALNRLSILCPGAVHFSIVSSNEMRKANEYITMVLGIKDYKNEPLFSKDEYWNYW